MRAVMVDVFMGCFCVCVFGNQFEVASGHLGLRVGGPDEEAMLFANVQAPLQQILEPDDIYYRILSQDVNLSGHY